jgi:hypothetical protein
MIEWYKSKELSIFFSNTPHVCIRYVLPSSTKDEIKSIKKYPFICKTRLEVALFDHIKSKSYKFTIPKGYCYDGASIPRFFHRIIGANTDNSFLIPALVHDVLCEHHNYIDNDREFSSKVFNALLEVSEVGNIKRFFMKNSVDLYQRFCGWRKENGQVYQ